MKPGLINLGVSSSWIHILSLAAVQVPSVVKPAITSTSSSILGSCLHPWLNVNKCQAKMVEIFRDSICSTLQDICVFICFQFPPKPTQSRPVVPLHFASCPTMWRRWCLGFCLCRTVLAVPSTACPDVEQGTLQVGPGGMGCAPLGGPVPRSRPSGARRVSVASMMTSASPLHQGIGSGGLSHGPYGEIWISSLRNSFPCVYIYPQVHKMWILHILYWLQHVLDLLMRWPVQPRGLINHTLCPVIAGLLEHGFFHKLWTLNKLTLLGGKDMLASDTFQMVSEGMCIPAFFSQSRVCPH